jgi:hypothetical protein
MVAVPATLAVTNPEAFTSATVASLDDQVTAIFVALAGLTVAVNEKVRPTVSD